MKKVKIAIKIMACLAIASFFFSCNPLENETRSASLLYVIELTGVDVEGNTANFLHSDVIVVDPDTGMGTVFDDAASATLKAELLNPNPDINVSLYNSIDVTRYVVSFTRSDGRNTPGVDVPYPFEGYLHTNIPIGGTASIGFIIVRAVAKLESPLIELHKGLGEMVIEVKAQIDFYGQDMANKNVKATGHLSIFFANWQDQ